MARLALILSLVVVGGSDARAAEVVFRKIDLKPLEQRPYRYIVDPIAKPPLPDKPLLLVANKHSDTLTYIDPESLEILDTIPTGPNPHEIVITPDQRYSGISKVISCRRCSLSNGIRISIRPSPVVARPSFR